MSLAGVDRGGVRKAVVAVAAMVLSAAALWLALASWVDLADIGLPMAWSGLGAEHTADGQRLEASFAPSINPLGWAAVVAAGVTFVAGVVTLAGRAQRAATALAGVALVSSLVGVAVTVAAVVAPDLLVGDVLQDTGFAGLDGASVRDAMLNTPVLYAEIAVLAMMTGCSAYLVVKR